MRFLFINLILLIFSISLYGQMTIDQTNTPYTITFDNTFNDVNQNAFLGEGFHPNPDPGQIDSDAFRVTGLSSGIVNFGDIATSGVYARGMANNDVNQGGIYAFEVMNNDFTLGANPRGGEFRPGSFTLRVINNTGNTVDITSIEYEFWFYNSEERSTQIEFGWSLDDVSYINVSQSNYATPTPSNLNPFWRDTSFATNIERNLNPGDTIFFRWTIRDNGGMGPSADQFGLNNISIVMGERGLLPVQWISFESKKNKSSTELNWKTAEEINNDQFLIQHSTDGEHWQVVDRKKAVDQEGMMHQYFYTHNDVAQGNNFYRLKQVDKDGAFDYSPVRRVFFSEKVLTGIFEIYPSPADELIMIENKALGNWEVFRIINEKGKVMQQFEQSLPNRINVASYAPGIYWIVAGDEKNIIKEKFIIQ